jgi:hypothetical protein
MLPLEQTTHVEKDDLTTVFGETQAKAPSRQVRQEIIELLFLVESMDS